MRGSQLTYGEYCGVCNEQVSGTVANGVGPNAGVVDNRAIMPGRTCGGFYMRIINPSGNLSNLLQIRGDFTRRRPAAAREPAKELFAWRPDLARMTIIWGSQQV